MFKGSGVSSPWNDFAVLKSEVTVRLFSVVVGVPVPVPVPLPDAAEDGDDVPVEEEEGVSLVHGE
jgi:hypothetical protein